MKEIAIIGGGMSGLVAAKYALECGMIPVIFEREADLGGLWNPRTGAMWRSLRTNTSHFTCMFSDFPWKLGSDINPNQKDMFEYIKAYVSHFDVEKYIKFGSKVINVKRVKEQWLIEYQNDSKHEKKMFNFVIVASGIFSKAKFPQLPDIESFKGTVIHSSEYKSPDLFKDKNTLILGGAYSGAEIAADLAGTAKKVFNLTSYPFWVIGREILSPSTRRMLAVDLFFYKRNTRTSPNETTIRTAEEYKKSNNYFDTICTYNRDQKQPYFHDPQSTDPTKVIVADNYIESIDNGNIVLKKSTIQEIKENSVVFTDGAIEQIDSIIMCTGYQTDLSFLDHPILDAIDYQPLEQFLPFLLYKTVFHPQLPNMGFVGMYRGPYMGVIELQAKWIGLVFSNQKKLPSSEIMQEGIQQEKAIREQQPRPQFPHADYVGFIDDLAKEIGVYPYPEELTGIYESLKSFITHGLVFPPVFQLVGPLAKPNIAMQEIKKAEIALKGEKTWHTKVFHYGIKALTLGLGVFTIAKIAQKNLGSVDSTVRFEV